MSDGGKGSRPRPFSVSNQEYAERWDAIFGRDKAKQDSDKEKEELKQGKDPVDSK